MFLIVHNKQVILGPMPWRPTMFKNTLMDDLEIDFDVPKANDERSVVVVNDEVKIIPFNGYTYPAIDTKTQRYDGPFYNYYDTYADGYYKVSNKPIDIIKDELKEQARAKRWEKEVSGFKTTVQGKEVWIATDRDKRQTYYHGIAGSWKFTGVTTMELPEPKEVPAGEIWLTVTADDLNSLYEQTQQHVQNAFNWEAAKIDEIDSKTTLKALKDLEV